MLLMRNLQASKRLENIRKTLFASAQKRSQTTTSAASFQHWRASVTTNNPKMATSRKVLLGVEDTGIVKNKPQNAETAAVTSALLQENHDKHHAFFNSAGYHNHIVHHLLTLYGLGAPSSVIEEQYKHNLNYQRGKGEIEERILADLTSPEHFKKYFGNQKYYPDYLAFFQNQIEEKGWENVLNQYVFAGDEVADDMLGRLYAGFLHPIIHLGFGIEFRQPSIIAEALSQAAIHDDWLNPFLISAEKATLSASPESQKKTLPELIDEIRSDKKLSTAAEWKDDNKIRDGIMKRAPNEMLKYISQWNVTEENLEEKTAEMIHNTIYFTAGAQHPPKQIKFDFYLMHCLNSSIFWPTFNSQTWLSTPNKIRLLRYKVYLDLTMYASRRSPTLLMEEISTYTPKHLEAGDAEWPGIFRRLCEKPDDGHAVKLGRAVRNAELQSEKYEQEGKNWLRIKGFMWLKVGNMVIDSVEDTGAAWVRSAGFEQAWDEFVDRPRKGAI